MVVMQDRNDGAPRRIDHLLTRQRRQSRGNLGDGGTGPDIGDPAVEQMRLPDQHVTECLRFTNERTAALSAPSDDAAGALGGTGGFRRVPPTNGAYPADTAAIDISTSSPPPR